MVKSDFSFLTVTFRLSKVSDRNRLPESRCVHPCMREPIENSLEGDTDVNFEAVRGNTSPLYTLNHKKRDILFLSITLANLNRFL